MAATVAEKIQELKKKRNAVILAHNYQSPEVQDIADYLGDSLDLSRAAASTSADVIVFCGVHFMAETAAILSPSKTVLLPAADAGCPMADMVDVAKLRALKEAHPNARVVTYVNTTAAVKAESDICCTSANAAAIVNAIDAEEIIFAPDKNLGRYVASKTTKKLVLADGFCHVHTRILKENILKAKASHPGAEVIVHPECSEEVVALADKILSTSGMCSYARKSAGNEMIIATENGIIHRLRKENPGKKFYAASEHAVCVNMKKTSLEKVLWALESMKHRVEVEAGVAQKARKAIEAMISYSRAE